MVYGLWKGLPGKGVEATVFTLPSDYVYICSK